jgi:hypothetical protein
MPSELVTAEHFQSVANHRDVNFAPGILSATTAALVTSGHLHSVADYQTVIAAETQCVLII